MTSLDVGQKAILYSSPIIHCVLLTNAAHGISGLDNISKLNILCSDDTLKKKAKEQKDCYAKIKGFPVERNSVTPDPGEI